MGHLLAISPYSLDKQASSKLCATGSSSADESVNLRGEIDSRQSAA